MKREIILTLFLFAVGFAIEMYYRKKDNERFQQLSDEISLQRGDINLLLEKS